MNFKLTRRGHSFKLNGNVLRHHFRTNKFLFNGVFKPFEAHANRALRRLSLIYGTENGGTGIGERRNGKKTKFSEKVRNFYEHRHVRDIQYQRLFRLRSQWSKPLAVK